MNIGTLLLGLLACTLPIVNLVQGNQSLQRPFLINLLISMGACALALCLQMVNLYQLVKREDFSALMDLAGSITTVASTLVIVTVLLNGLSIMRYQVK
ncbi:hypothetical protein N781_04780 [Pontibacillus halophilus JSM 076056 = DSM 19796]|uniref:Uncharacterized protein n=1 Tax=Pontibacillus halophilus JSM 076056 = DSM 19796 TaxID=1385510 RepID=A0A0A5I6B8_9BACI|nr:hypothetical protein N781_04780 [Pontibacillus halophilus JSM 076056 = DSM 19796]